MQTWDEKQLTWPLIDDPLQALTIIRQTQHLQTNIQI